jgi:hypothetical protein
VFIVGMPRSGSTLVEQILSSHPAIHGAGEVKYLSRALGAIRDRFPALPRFPAMLDKLMPTQFGIIAKNYLGQITTGLPAPTETDAAATRIFERSAPTVVICIFKMQSART